MSFYRGSAALAGVINLVSERSERDETVARAEIEAGNGSAFRTAASFSDGFTGGDYFAAVQWEEEAGRVAEDRFQQLHLLGNLNLNLGESAGLSLGTRVASWESDDYPEASGGPLLGSGEVRQSEHEEMSLRADLRLGEPARRPRSRRYPKFNIRRDIPATPTDSSNRIRSALSHRTQPPRSRQRAHHTSAGKRE